MPNDNQLWSIREQSRQQLNLDDFYSVNPTQYSVLRLIVLSAHLFGFGHTLHLCSFFNCLRLSLSLSSPHWLYAKMIRFFFVDVNDTLDLFIIMMTIFKSYFNVIIISQIGLSQSNHFGITIWFNIFYVVQHGIWHGLFVLSESFIRLSNF